jgi:hypothetical protein
MENKKTNLTSTLDLLGIDDTFLEEFSSVSLSPLLTWAKFVLSDDKPNANRKRVPLEEFDNLIKTGIYMPIKMSEGTINDGHEGSYPIGVIAHLKRVKDRILGLAALWNRERPEDVNFIKENYKKGNPLELSWEILYTDSAIEEATGVEDLRNTVLRATTFVRKPAYEGRTPILEVAAKTETEPTIVENTVTNGGGTVEVPKVENSTQEEIMEETTVVQNTVSDIVVQSESQDNNMMMVQPEDDTDSTVEGLLAQIETLKKLLEEKMSEIQDLLGQNSALAEFKTSVEKEKAETSRIAIIKRKFADANIQKDDEYFSEKKETFLAMDDAAIDFMLQEMLAFVHTVTTVVENNSSVSIPQIMPKNEKPTVDDYVKFLKAFKK